MLFGSSIGGASIRNCREEEIECRDEDKKHCCIIDDCDFVARFKHRRWEVAWKWKNDHRVGSLSSKNICNSTDEDKKEFDAEIKLLLDERMITKHNPETHRQIRNYLNLIPIRQMKGTVTKYRRVLDY